MNVLNKWIYFTMFIGRMSVSFFFTGFWPICVFIMVAVQTTQLNSSYNLVTLTFNRYFAVTNPNLCNILFSWKRSLIVSVSIWMCTFTVTCILYISPEKSTYMSQTRTSYDFTVRLITSNDRNTVVQSSAWTV